MCLFAKFGPSDRGTSPGQGDPGPEELSATPPHLQTSKKMQLQRSRQPSQGRFTDRRGAGRRAILGLPRVYFLRIVLSILSRSLCIFKNSSLCVFLKSHVNFIVFPVQHWCLWAAPLPLAPAASFLSPGGPAGVGVGLLLVPSLSAPFIRRVN